MYNSSQTHESTKAGRDHRSDPNNGYYSGPYETESQTGGMIPAPAPPPNTAAYGVSNANRGYGPYGHASPIGLVFSPGPEGEYNYSPNNASYDPAIYQNCTTNLFGRSFRETLNDWPKINRNQRARRDYTPSLTSNDSDSTSHTSSSYAPSPFPAYNKVAPPPSALPKDGSAKLAPKIYIASENASVQSFNSYPSVHGNERGTHGSEYYQATTTPQGDAYMGQQKVPYSQSYYAQAPSNHSQSAVRKGSFAK